MLRPPRPPGTTADLDATIVRLNQSLVDSLNNQRRFKQQVHSDLNAILGRLAACADAVARASGPSAAPAIIDLNNQIDQLDAAIAGIDGHRLSQTDVDEAIAPVISQERNMRFDTDANRQAFRRAPSVYNSTDGRSPRAFGTRSSGSDGSPRSDGSAGPSRGWFSGLPSLFGSPASSDGSPARSDGSTDIGRPASAFELPPGGPPVYSSLPARIDPSRSPGDPGTVLTTTSDDDWRRDLGIDTGSPLAGPSAASRLTPGGMTRSLTRIGGRTRKKRR